MGHNRVKPKLLLLVALVLNLLAAAAPFRLELPEIVQNRVQEQSDGALVFDAPSIARTPAAPLWVEDAMASGELAIELRVTPASTDQSGPARIFSLSRDYLSHNLVIGQEGANLAIRLRRPGSSAAGQPAFWALDVFEAGHTSDIAVRIGPERLQVEVDGEIAIDKPLPYNALSGWDADYKLALGNEVVGLRPWNGTIERAVVTTPAHREGLLANGVLQKPAQWWQLPSRLRVAFGFAFPDDVLPTLLHVLAFMPIGYAALRLSRGPGNRALLVVLVLVLVLAIGVEGTKILFAGRHPTIWNMIANVTGGLAGALMLPGVLARLRKH